MLVRHFEPFEAILYDWFFAYNNNVHVGCQGYDSFGTLFNPDEHFYLNCNNNSNNITRRKRGRQTTFHKVGGHPCLRLDLSSVDRDEQLLSVSPPPLLRRVPPSLPSLPAPSVADRGHNGGSNTDMGSGASSSKPTAVVSSDTNVTNGVDNIDRNVTLMVEPSRPLMPVRNEAIHRESLISGGAVKEESDKQSLNNNAASPNRKKSKDSNSNNQKELSTDAISVNKVEKDTAKPSECHCTPVSQRKKSTKPPSYEAYASLEYVFFREGREVDYVQGDGNCFFRALSKEIYGSEDSHYELRQMIVDLMSRHRNEFEQYTDTSSPQSFASHVSEMRQFAVWATTAEIYAAATLLQRDIYVFSPDHTGTRYSWLLFSPCFPREAEIISPCPQCYITLCHTNGNHYDRVAPLDGRCNCSQSPPELGEALLAGATDSAISLYAVNNATDNRLDRTITPGE